MTSRADLTAMIHGHIAEFNKKGADLTDATTFAGDLEWDSLTVMDFVAAIEDEFCRAVRVTLAGSITPDFTRSSYAPVATLKP